MKDTVYVKIYNPKLNFTADMKDTVYVKIYNPKLNFTAV